MSTELFERLAGEVLESDLLPSANNDTPTPCNATFSEAAGHLAGFTSEGEPIWAPERTDFRVTREVACRLAERCGDDVHFLDTGAGVDKRAWRTDYLRHKQGW